MLPQEPDENGSQVRRMSLVLIYEQESAVAKPLSDALVEVGIGVRHARSEFEARTALKSCCPDLVCIGAETGAHDGYAAVSRWRRANPETPIVVMSGRDDLTRRSWAERIDAKAFLLHPFSLTRFRELVQYLLRQAILSKGGLCAGSSIMMYSHDTIGLGHMRRNSAIASQITSKFTDASVLMLVGSPTGAFFDLGPGVDFIKLPSLVKVGRDRWQPGSLRVSASTARDLRASLISNAVDTYQPDVLLVDHEPAGVWDELVPVLKKLGSLPSPPRIVLGLRDILDDPERIKAGWRSRGICELIRNYYDDILIYGNRHFFPTHDHYGLEEIKPGRVHYCGLVTAVSNTSPRPSHRSGIVVAGGGGRDAAPMFRAILEGLERLAPAERPAVKLISGPLMEGDIRSELSDFANKLGAVFVTSVSDLTTRLRNAALFVTMGGYNSLTEAIATGVPTLVIPRTGPSSEQRLRAAKMAELGLMNSLTISEASPEVLATILRNPAICRAQKAHDLSLNGAKTAADFIGSVALKLPTSVSQTGIREAANG